MTVAKILAAATTPVVEAVPTQIPGAVLGVVTTAGDRAVTALGQAQTDPTPAPMHRQTWFDLAAWAKDTQSLQPWQRSLSFSLGRAAGNGKPPTRKQAVHGEKILTEARSLGVKG